MNNNLVQKSEPSRRLELQSEQHWKLATNQRNTGYNWDIPAKGDQELYISFPEGNILNMVILSLELPYHRVNYCHHSYR